MTNNGEAEPEDLEEWSDLQILNDLMECYDLNPSNTLADLIEAITEADQEEGE